MNRSIAVILISAAALLVAGVIIYAVSNTGDANCGGEGQPTCEEYCSANLDARECQTPTGRTASCGGIGEPDCPRTEPGEPLE